jgi:hypothetical protein
MRTPAAWDTAPAIAACPNHGVNHRQVRPISNFTGWRVFLESKAATGAHLSRWFQAFIFSSASITARMILS